jgi:hypothetical protein
LWTMASGELVPEEQEKRAVVQRIADSAGFRSAPRLRDFLLFVTDLALSGRTDQISERHIGHAVFRRSADYDTANDNIVPVSARQVRIKLKEYGEREGGADPSCVRRQGAEALLPRLQSPRYLHLRESAR